MFTLKDAQDFCTGMFCTESNYDELVKSAEQNEWTDNIHAWQPVEDEEIGDILLNVDDAAQGLLELVNSKTAGTQ